MRFITGPESNGATVISAGLTLAILVLPIVIITSAEALRAVPGQPAGGRIRGGRHPVGSGPQPRPPVRRPRHPDRDGAVVGQGVGEAAPLILVGATTGFLSEGAGYSLSSLQERFTAMPIIIYTWAGRTAGGLPGVATSAAIVVLLVVVLLANTVAILLRNKYEKRR